MSYVSGGDGGTLQVTGQDLENAVPSFFQGGHTVEEVITTTSQFLQNVLTDASVVSELNQFVNSLNTFQQNLNKALACANTGLIQLGLALDIAAGEYMANENVNAELFENIGGKDATNTPSTGTQPGSGSPSGPYPPPFPVPFPAPGPELP